MFKCISAADIMTDVIAGPKHSNIQLDVSDM